MQRTCDLSSGWRVYQVIGQRKLRRIEEIEYLAPQFDLSPFLKLKVLEQGGVNIAKARPSQAPAS